MKSKHYEKIVITLFVFSFLCILNPSSAFSQGIRGDTVFGVFANHTLPADGLSGQKGASGGGLSFGADIFVTMDISLSRFQFASEDSSQDQFIDCLGINIGIPYGELDWKYVPYVLIGVGQYFPDKGSPGFGVNFGHSVRVPIRSRKLGVDIAGKYHHIYNGGMKFYEFRLGLVWNFPT